MPTDRVAPDESSPKIFTLSQVSASLQAVVTKNYPGRYWVKAEMTRLHHYPHSGHCYPDLVEKNGEKVVAQFRAIIWADTYLSLNQRFEAVTGRKLQDGMNILFQASVTFHPQYGLSLHIHDIEPSYTLGEMARQKMAAINRLKKDGEFDLNHLIAFPYLPSRIAVISVETSKGYGDFCNIMRTHGSRYRIHWELFPALLQGLNAGPSIIGKLEEIHRDRHLFDVVVIVRGGGGDAGLDCYDEYTLARVVARFPLPVVTGIGHATNQTVVEMVAHANKITPTDVAYSIVKAFELAERNLQALGQRMHKKTRQLTDFEKTKIALLGQSMATSVKNRVTGDQHKLQRITDLLPVIGRSFILQNRENLHSQQQWMRGASRNLLGTERALLTTIPDRLIRGVLWLQRDQSRQLQHLDQRLRQSDPSHMLKRGYSIATANGKIIRSVNDLKTDAEITTLLSDGSLISRITQIFATNKLPDEE